MSLTREFLEAQGLEKEVVDKVMTKHGQTVNPLRKDIESLELEKTQLEEQVTERDTQLSELKKSGDEELLTKIQALEDANRLKAEENERLRKEHAVDLAVEKAGTTAKDYLKFELNGLEYKDGELVGLEEKLNFIKEAQPKLFEVEVEKEPLKKWSQGGVSTTNVTLKTREEIMAVKDNTQRQRLIAENRELFK